MNFIDNRSKGEHNGTPLHKTTLYKKLIQFGQAGAPLRYGPRSKCRLRPCSRALVGAAEDRTQASRMRHKDSTTELLLLLLVLNYSKTVQVQVQAPNKIFNSPHYVVKLSYTTLEVKIEIIFLESTLIKTSLLSSI